MNRRTHIDFSKHVLTVTKQENYTKYEFKVPGTVIHSLIYINVDGLLVVKGDFGNWIFCREFHPSADKNAGVSGGYWDEKLEISSEQKSDKYDPDATKKLIDDFKRDFEDNYGREMNEEEKDWIESLEDNVDDEFEYTHIAYRENPSTIDYESVPFGKERHFWLNVVYDGFDAMCERLREEEEEKVV